MGLTRLDFVQRAAPPAGWRLGLLVCALGALTVAGANWIVQLRAAAALDEQLGRNQPRSARSVPLSPAQSRLQEQQLASVADAVRQLNLPVARLLGAVAAPPDMHVALLGLDLASESAAGSLKISAEARSPQDMMNYVGHLDEQPALDKVYLVRHEIAERAPGRPYRFVVEARWVQ